MSKSRCLGLLPLLLPIALAACRCSPKASSPGEAIFLQRCAVCHSTGAGNGQGPGLGGVVGRRAGTNSGYPYSFALKKSGLLWDRGMLDKFLASPGALVPGTLMPLSVPDPIERRQLVGYLAHLDGDTSPQIAGTPARRQPPEGAVQAPVAPPTSLQGLAAFGDYLKDGPGVRRHITAADLPAPYETHSSMNGPAVCSQPPGFRLSVPPGFQVTPFAQGFVNPRLMRTAPNGDVFVAETAANRVRVVRTTDGAAAPQGMEIFAEKLDHPFGISFYPPGPDPKWVYVANFNSVVRFPYRAGDLKARGEAQIIVPKLTASGGGHSTRDVVFSKDGARMFVSVGSASNDAEGIPLLPPESIVAFEKNHARGADWAAEENRADVLVFDPEGKQERIFATGIRNCVGLETNPTTGDVWCSTNERDGLGDNLVPDYLTRVADGSFFGWPWLYIGDHYDPRHKNERPDLVGHVAVPDVIVQPHSASLEMTFYQGAMFPPAYRGNAFAAFHGSWNRSTRTGYKIVRVIVKDGVPTGEYEDFVTGFVVNDGFVWGRPVGVTVARDGALLFTEDGNNTMWRVTYSGAR